MNLVWLGWTLLVAGRPPKLYCLVVSLRLDSMISVTHFFGRHSAFLFVTFSTHRGSRQLCCAHTYTAPPPGPTYIWWLRPHAHTPRPTARGLPPPNSPPHAPPHPTPHLPLRHRTRPTAHGLTATHLPPVRCCVHFPHYGRLAKHFQHMARILKPVLYVLYYRHACGRRNRRWVMGGRNVRGLFLNVDLM